MRILFLSPRQCWPPHSGAKLREFHFARALGQHAKLTYAYFAEPGEKTLSARELPFCEQIVSVPKPSTYGTLNLVRGVFGRLPLPVLNYTSTEMLDALRRIRGAHDFDLVHLDLIHMIRYAEEMRYPRVLYNWHNIESELMHRYSQSVPSAARRIYAAHTGRKLEVLERRILESAFGHVVCSERERRQLQQIAPQARIAVIENGVDVAQFAAAVTGGKPESRIVFVGKMDYYPNIEAITQFVGGVWQSIRKRWPDLRLSVVGANPPDTVLALRQNPGVEVTGTVPDVSPYYRGTLAAIVPLRTGGGTRLKILEAMAARTPVISTAIGAEGLAVTPGKDILIAPESSASEWIEHLGLLADSPERRAAITEAALELVRSRYDWPLLGEQLWSQYESWLGTC